ncbi:Uncharacterised protein [Mycobacteroides abscessus subsp. abscessus]|nr:Uncharacterised protein [Mycobacteroides abscessus subsp. abscessus]
MVSTRLISPVLPDLFITVNVCKPDRADFQSSAQPSAVTVTWAPASRSAAGRIAITAAASSAGTTTMAAATATGRWPIRRAKADGSSSSSGPAGEGAIRETLTNAGMTTTRYPTQAST